MRVVTLTLMVALSARVAAQTPPETRIRLVVRDTSGVAMAGVDVVVVRGVNEALASGTTDEGGRRTLTVPRAGRDYQLVVRKVGYQRIDRFFRTGDVDSLAFDIVLRPTTQQLETVTITAEQDLKRKSYHVDADEIANSDRVLIDASDILTKLRVDMICGRSCNPFAGGAAAARNPVRACPGLVFQQPPRMSCPPDTSPPEVTTNIWVNGRRIRTIIPSEMAMARRSGALGGLSVGSLTLLQEIKPEHVDEMTYIDEFDTSIGKIGSQGALFIVLKQGVVYEPGKESFIAPTAATKNAVATGQLPSYRYRLLGVFDEATGEPIEGAEVLDVQTGTKARTTVTGTVSLVYLPEGGSPVRISKAGYEDITLAVEISAATTIPITIVMTKRPPG